MGQSPPGDSCNNDGNGVPLLNGPTEFGSSSPTPVQWTDKPVRFAAPGDILFCVRGSTGRMNIADQQYCIGRGLAAIRGKTSTDTILIRHAIQLRLSALLQVATGSTFPSLARDDIGAMEIPWPSDSERRMIAEVLGALDDKIESNRRLIDTSMALSEATYVSWRNSFEEVRETTFGDYTDVFGGATPSTSEPGYWGGPHVWIAPRDVTAMDSVYLYDSERHITDLGLAQSSTTLHPPGSIFMTSRATIGAFAINQVPCAPNQGFIVVRPRDPSDRWFLFHEMRSRVGEMHDRATGTTFRELSRGSFREMSVVIPADQARLAALDDLVAPVHARAAAAASESFSLKKLRMMLLPELLSGRLRVRDAEKFVEESV